MKELINGILEKFDVRLVRKQTFDNLMKNQARFRAYEMAQLIEERHFLQFLENIPYSKSQLSQDLFVLSELDFKRDGFFVEFGATNGIDLSNTYLMEKRFGWSGILAEPARLWHDGLGKNRSAAIEYDCVWSESGERLTFNEVHDELHQGELSTIDKFSGADRHKSARADGKKYEVTTISLSDLLDKHEAPKVIDYLSIDTEGSEFEILKAFDFNRYDIKIISCEHNHTPLRQKILELLSGYGYERKFTNFSLFDDWYVRR
jgi:FkbM family methyltransferase